MPLKELKGKKARKRKREPVNLKDLAGKKPFRLGSPGPKGKPNWNNRGN